MKTSTLFSLFVTYTFASLLPFIVAQSTMEVTDEIIANAAADNIDLTALDFLDTALAEITNIYDEVAVEEGEDLRRRRLGLVYGRRGLLTGEIIKKQNMTEFLADAQRVDVHTHVTPTWYRNLVPTTGGNPTPTWDLNAHMEFMESSGIDRSIIAFSAPGANIYQDSKLTTVGLARLINEQTAAYCARYPTKLKFYAVLPLPYVREAIVEAQYALTSLGAVGIVLTSNYEGTYLGAPEFTPFFEAIDKISGKTVVYVHPGTPYLKYNGQLIEANPTTYPTGNIEFFFETARTLMDLTLTQTIHNFTSVNYVVPHVGGAFPSILDRMLKSAPTIYNSSIEIYKTRFWWDSAGPTYYHQVSGLLGSEIPKSQLLFGTDYPYAPAFTQAGSLGAILASPLFTDEERIAIFSTSVKSLFDGVNA